MPALHDLSVSISERQFGQVHGGPINLSRAELCRARLDQATLIEANLMGAVLTEADLSDARLEKADLRGAKLAYANLDGARLDGANVCAADLRLARGLTQAQIDQGVGDRRTSLPANLRTPRAWLQQGPSEPGEGADRTKRAVVASEETSLPMRERLKSINQTNQELKERERQASQRHVGSRIVYAAVLVAAIAVGALVAMIEIHL